MIRKKLMLAVGIAAVLLPNKIFSFISIGRYDYDTIRSKHVCRSDHDNFDSENEINNLAVEGYRYRARVAYDGTGFSGWQVQSNKSNARTIQGEIESVLSTRFNRSIKIVGSSRTDTGVHARGQAIHFDLERELDVDEVQKLEYAMNSMLRRDIRIWNVEVAPRAKLIRDEKTGVILQQKWHAIIDSRYKLYSYRFSKSHYLDPLERYTRAHFYDKFCSKQFERIMKAFEGTHNFRAFAGAIEANERKKGRNIGTVRTVKKINVIDEGNDRYRVDIYVEGALYKMVRNMVGSAIATCTGQLNESDFFTYIHQPLNEDAEKHKIYTRDDNPAKPAPPEGLTLEQVFFDDEF